MRGDIIYIITLDDKIKAATTDIVQAERLKQYYSDDTDFSYENAEICEVFDMGEQTLTKRYSVEFWGVDKVTVSKGNDYVWGGKHFGSDYDAEYDYFSTEVEAENRDEAIEKALEDLRICREVNYG